MCMKEFVLMLMITAADQAFIHARLAVSGNINSDRIRILLNRCRHSPRHTIDHQHSPEE